MAALATNIATAQPQATPILSTPLPHIKGDVSVAASKAGLTNGVGDQVKPWHIQSNDYACAIALKPRKSKGSRGSSLQVVIAQYGRPLSPPQGLPGMHGEFYRPISHQASNCIHVERDGSGDVDSESAATQAGGRWHGLLDEANRGTGMATRRSTPPPPHPPLNQPSAGMGRQHLRRGRE